MATIRLTVTVDDIDATLTIFDQIKIYRSVTGATGTYLEITGPGMRITLVAGQSVYEYVDASGDPDYWYKSSFFNSSTLAESSLSDAIHGSVEPLYIDVDDLRAEGFVIPPGGDEEARALELIKTYQQIVDGITGNFFIPRQLTLDVDGRDVSLLQLPYAIISISAMYINGDFENAVDPSRYVVYDGRGGEDGRDDRRNPRIKLVSEEQSIFAGVGPVARTGAVFLIGEKNQRVVGTFGFVESTGCTPYPIKLAMKRLVARAYSNPLGGGGGGGGGGSFASGPVVEEETDRHRREWGDAASGSKMWPVSGTGDLEVDLILARYKRPILVKGPRTMRGRNRRTLGL
jgi:hypothetical protein